MERKEGRRFNFEKRVLSRLFVLLANFEENENSSRLSVEL